MKIITFEEFMDLTLRMVRMTETDDELAICAAATIGSLHQRGHNDLALQVLATYEPKKTESPCNCHLLDNDDLDNGSTCYHCYEVHKDGLCDCEDN